MRSPMRSLRVSRVLARRASAKRSLGSLLVAARGSLSRLVVMMVERFSL